jgi:hypothetical protein
VVRCSATQSPEDVARVLEALVSEWRAVLRAHAPEARQMLRKLLRGRVVATPDARHEQPGYRVRGSATVEPLLNVVLRSDGDTHKRWRPHRETLICALLSTLGFRSRPQFQIAWRSEDLRRRSAFDTDDRLGALQQPRLKDRVVQVRPGLFRGPDGALLRGRAESQSA